MYVFVSVQKFVGWYVQYVFMYVSWFNAHANLIYIFLHLDSLMQIEEMWRKIGWKITLVMGCVYLEKISLEIIYGL